MRSYLWTLPSLLLSSVPLTTSLPQDGSLDIASGSARAWHRPLGGLAGSRAASSHPSPLKSTHIKNPRHRPTCDLSLPDDQVCGQGEACVQDPFAESTQRQKSLAMIGICTGANGGNMCGGLLGSRRGCGSDGWRCGKPARCERDNVSDCDWLCVRPPPSSVSGGKGFGF